MRFHFFLLVFSLSACAPHKNPAVQTALDELTRLNSCIEAGVNYPEYSERLLNAKANIAVALEHIDDTGTKNRIEIALICHEGAREAWEREIHHINFGLPDVHTWWKKAIAASEHAKEYAYGDKTTRQKVIEKENAEVMEEIARENSKGLK